MKLKMVDFYHGVLSGGIGLEKGDELDVPGDILTKEAADELVTRGKAEWVKAAPVTVKLEKPEPIEKPEPSETPAGGEVMASGQAPADTTPPVDPTRAAQAMEKVADAKRRQPQRGK